MACVDAHFFRQLNIGAQVVGTSLTGNSDAVVPSRHTFPQRRRRCQPHPGEVDKIPKAKKW
ncbi:hypothetical protein F3Y22_tig00110413pilonHSYRG00040 [Hibiscus syriacus]|uniref:Uncharacterized protein n=1 Tax=Hibiscus syriacus TaxID=106335 RepID=A0A6A3AMZ0_HIBSY|nr:hypothetical protein F3Y22_tig00110413pilonHSYRG00040 [Hibiscus syriacus]